MTKSISLTVEGQCLRQTLGRNMSIQDIKELLKDPLIRKLILVLVLGLGLIVAAANADMTQSELNTVLSIVVTLVTLAVGCLVTPLGAILTRGPRIYRRRKP